MRASALTLSMAAHFFLPTFHGVATPGATLATAAIDPEQPLTLDWTAFNKPNSLNLPSLI